MPPSEWIGNLLRVEPFALVEHAHDELARIGDRGEGELHRHQFAGVFAVAVLDRVDDRLTHRDANPVDGVFVHAGELADAVADDLDQVDHIEVAVDLHPDGAAAGQHAGTRSPARLRPGANERRDTDTKCTRVSNILNRIPPGVRML
jgi:hypothetical protein